MNLTESLGFFSAALKRRYFGYFTGHHWLDAAQLAALRRTLDSPESPEFATAYEQACASLLGGGDVISFAAGRMAFHAILKARGIGPGDEVILTGFTCSVMANAVWRRGATPIYADITLATMGTSPANVAAKITPRTRLIAAQHTFGLPCAIDELAALARSAGIYLVEDCALSVGSKFDGRPLGTWGDAAIFSTDHSKPLNTVTGGFLFTRDAALAALAAHARTAHAALPALDAAHQRRLYDRLCFERRWFSPQRYGRGRLFGKLAGAARKLRSKISGQEQSTFLDADFKPRLKASSYPYPARLPPFLAQLGLLELERWPQEAAQRRAVLDRLLALAVECGLTSLLPGAYTDPRCEIVPLRLIYTHPAAAEISRRMSADLDLDWVWFKEPIVCATAGPESFQYQAGTCPVAEEAGSRILNWPCVVPPADLPRLAELFAKCHRGL